MQYIPMNGQWVTRPSAIFILTQRGDSRERATEKVDQWLAINQRAEEAALRDGWSGES